MEWPTMPDAAAEGFRLWATVAGRNAAEVARMLGIPYPTVAGWSQRYRWPDRAAAEDVAERDAMIAGARARLARLLPRSLDVLADALGGGEVSRHAVAAAFGVLDRHGISPVRLGSLDVTHRAAAPAPVTDAEIDALIASGDIGALLALASGRPAPLPSGTHGNAPPRAEHDATEARYRIAPDDAPPGAGF